MGKQSRLRELFGAEFAFFQRSFAVSLVARNLPFFKHPFANFALNLVMNLPPVSFDEAELDQLGALRAGRPVSLALGDVDEAVFFLNVLVAGQETLRRSG